jgi:hypothetical protein
MVNAMNNLRQDNGSDQPALAARRASSGPPYAEVTRGNRDQALAIPLSAEEFWQRLGL